jgi:hypothetical protein
LPYLMCVCVVGGAAHSYKLLMNELHQLLARHAIPTKTFNVLIHNRNLTFLY